MRKTTFLFFLLALIMLPAFITSADEAFGVPISDMVFIGTLTLPDKGEVQFKVREGTMFKASTDNSSTKYAFVPAFSMTDTTKVMVYGMTDDQGTVRQIGLGPPKEVALNTVLVFDAKAGLFIVRITSVDENRHFSVEAPPVPEHGAITIPSTEMEKDFSSGSVPCVRTDAWQVCGNTVSQ